MVRPGDFEQGGFEGVLCALGLFAPIERENTFFQRKIRVAAPLNADMENKRDWLAGRDDEDGGNGGEFPP